ncbi:hypothetical protein HK105_204927 [Polyrhizophydium stewartii]|uniref:Uncharacterized protein n=1 Tax=Polyrhizophydium stewartii TaxID=2732419 RepID=A0ABR4N7P2_9FUNG
MLSTGHQIPPAAAAAAPTVAILLFVLATAAIALVHNVALIQGDFRRLVYPRDSEGNLCGVSVGQDSLRDLQPARYLAYYNLSLPNGLRRCVSSCPATSQSLAALVCTYGSDPRDSDPPASRAALVSSGNCTTAYASSQVLYRCVPNALTQGSANTSLAGWSAALASDLGTETYLGVLFQQLQSFWWTVAISLTASILLSFAWILLLVAVGKAIVWITVVLLILLSVGVSGFLVAAYIYLQYFDASPLSCILAAFGGGSAYTNMALLIVSIVCCVATAAVIVAVVLLRRAIRLSASIIVETSKDFRQQHALGGIAFARFCVVALVGLYSVAVIMLLSTIGTVRQTSSLTYAVNGRTVSVDRGLVFVPSQLAVFLEVTVALWFLWFFGAADAIASIAISGAITECYFTRDKTNIMHSFAARNAISRTLLHHMGSAILGCVAIPAMAVTNAVVFSIATSFLKVRKVGDAERKDLFFDRWGAWYQKMQFAVNDKAYIMGRALALRNAVKLKVVSGVAASVLFFGRLVITILAAIGGLALVIISTGSSTPLTSLAPIALVIVIFAFIGASVFVTPLGVAIETIFLCFCEDVEMNDGSLERPYYMSDSLKKFMGHHRRQSALPDKPPGLEANHMSSGNELMNEGAKALAKTTFFGKPKPDHDAALQCFEQAGTMFLAAKALETAANLVAQNMNDPRAAGPLFQQASHMFLAHGSADRAGEMLEKAAKSLETSDPAAATQFYLDSCAVFEDEDRLRMGVDTFKRAIAFCLRAQRMDTAMALSDRLEIAFLKLDNQPSFARQALTNVVLQLAVGNESGARLKIEDASRKSGRFEQTDDGQVANDLLTAIETGDEPLLANIMRSSPIRFLDNEVGKLARGLRADPSRAGTSGAHSQQQQQQQSYQQQQQQQLPPQPGALPIPSTTDLQAQIEEEGFL